MTQHIIIDMWPSHTCLASSCFTPESFQLNKWTSCWIESKILMCHIHMHVFASAVYCFLWFSTNVCSATETHLSVTCFYEHIAKCSLAWLIARHFQTIFKHSNHVCSNNYPKFNLLAQWSSTVILWFTNSPTSFFFSFSTWCLNLVTLAFIYYLVEMVFSIWSVNTKEVDSILKLSC